MNVVTNLERTETEEEKEMFQAQLRQQKLEDYAHKFISNNEISKERKNDNDMLKEDMKNIIGDGVGPFVFSLPNGEFAVVKQSIRTIEVLDKDAMAQHLGISKDEIKTAFDISILTRNGKINPEMITSFTIKQERRSITVRAAKTNPLEKKSKKFKKKSF